MTWTETTPMKRRYKSKFSDKITIALRRHHKWMYKTLLILIGTDLLPSLGPKKGDRIAIFKNDEIEGQYLLKYDPDGYRYTTEPNGYRVRFSPTWPYKLPTIEKTHLVKHEIVDEGIIFYIE